MSDTELELQPSPSAEPQPTDGQPQAAEPQQPEPQKTPEETNWERRVNRLTSRVNQTMRERDELAQRLAQIEQAQRQSTGQPQITPEMEQYINQEVERRAQQRQFDRETEAFHAAGYAAYEDWNQRRANLVAMGADAGIAALLVGMPDGARIAGELHDNPAELERIADIKSERGRAVALGQFAAKLEQRPARTVSRAPRPPQPVTGRAAPSFNEYNASAQDLVTHYTKLAMEQQRR